MVNSKRHPLIDGLLMATMVLSSFGVFMYVLAQTGTISEDCIRAGITDTAGCYSYLSSLNATTTSATDTNTTGTNTTSTSTSTSTGTTTTIVSCSDSDARDILNKGYVSTASSVIYDRCIDDKQVEENFCLSNGANAEVLRCADGYACGDGRCVVVPAPVTTTVPVDTTSAITTNFVSCSDTDGGDAPMIVGYVTSGGQNFEDKCINTVTVEEQFCDASGRLSKQHQCFSGYECRGGRCAVIAVTAATTITATDTEGAESDVLTTASVCTDTDGGKVYDNRGYVSMNGVGYPDFCTDAGTLQEQFCEGGQRRFENRLCGDGRRCQDGKCVTYTTTVPVTTGVISGTVKPVCGNGICEAALGETATACAVDCVPTNTAPTTVAAVCADTDGGKVYDNRGYVSLAGVGYPDFCTDADTLQEQFCDGGQRRFETRSCGDGRRCQDGKCVTYTAATLTTPTTTAIKTIVPEADTNDVVEIESYLPSICTEMGITDATTCAALIKKNSETSGTAVTLPQECIRAGLSTKEECERFLATMAVSLQCREAGITSPDACRKFLVEQSAVPNLDSSCRSAGILTASACEQYLFEKKLAATDGTDTGNIEAADLPERCIAASISDEMTCSKYLAFSDLSLECLSAGIETKVQCSEYLNSKLVEPICSSQGITDPAACKEFVYGRMTSGVSCSGLSADQCSLVVKERHLGAIVEINAKIDKIEDSLDEVSSESGHIDFSKLEEDADAGKLARLNEVLPIKSDGRQLLALKSRQQVSVGEDDSVEAGASRIIAYDTDGDGITDDTEKRLGFNPESADSDGDGNWDKDEIMAERNRMAPIDRAILDGKEIGQPLTEGDVDPKLSVSLPEKAAADDMADPRGVVFEGTGDPGSVVTLYVYSELPVVVTTTVNEDGTWSYEFDDSLSDGAHEVYVAVNDDTGKVTRKSNPLSFLIQGASAATTAQAASEAALTDISPFVAAQEAPSYDIRMFLVGGAALLLLAFGLIAALFRRPEQVQ